MSSRRKPNKLNSNWIAHTREMRESFAWRYLPDNARRVLDRLELEHMNHGGAENGRLPCTYDDFAKWGIRRQSVSKAIRQCEVLGFVEVTVRGGRSRAENRWPSLYRLTYPNGTSSSAQPTDDWRNIKTAAEAVAALQYASRNLKSRVRKRTTVSRATIAPTANRLPGAKMQLLS
jgi:DNA-binding transcriptional MocR family regulator